ncbi:MAG TPA: hypothetical protein VK806_10845 [Bacteroidia bacterium]|jgi:hypothetical protein|nr:hypothetical protein [Bacteroidia bacterium]
MEWYHYFSGFWAGAFLGNFVPHFVKGVCGDKFPTPFSKPPGRGLSSPVVNVLWSLLNLLVAYLLYTVGKVSFQDNLSILLFFIGFAAISIMMALNFAKKHKE